MHKDTFMAAQAVLKRLRHRVAVHGRCDRRLFSFDGKKEFRFLGKTHLVPVGPMAVTGDGRLYGFCGDDMANLFCCDRSLE
jgi:hypothetical protein